MTVRCVAGEQVRNSAWLRQRALGLSFPQKLILAFALAISVPLLGYALAMHGLNQTRMTLMDKAALEHRLRIADQSMTAAGLTVLQHATSAAAASGTAPWEQVLEAAARTDALAGACVVFPDGRRPPVVLGRDLALDGLIGASPYAQAAAREGPTWGLLGVGDALAVVAAAPVQADAAGDAAPAVVVLARRMDGPALSGLVGRDACTVHVEPLRGSGLEARAASVVREAERHATRPAWSMLQMSTSQAGLEAAVLLPGALPGVEPMLLRTLMQRAALPGRGPQFMTVALCALACAILLAALLTSLVSAWVARPLDDLRSRVEAVAAGERKTPPLETGAEDAIGRVGRAFNHMVHSLDEAQRKAVQNERLIVAGRMAATVAHEVRNVLTPIQLRADMLLQGVHDPVARQNLVGMRDEIYQGAALLRTLLEFARTGTREQRPVEIGDIVERATGLVAPQFCEARVHLAVAAERVNGTHVMGDSGQLLQVLVNLLNNALEADARHVSIGADVVNDGVRIVVTDDGTGMDRATVERALEPFFTTKPAGRGTGLGLSICQSIIGEHGGSLEIQSTKHIGTTITVHLPKTGA